MRRSSWGKIRTKSNNKHMPRLHWYVPLLFLAIFLCFGCSNRLLISARRALIAADFTDRMLLASVKQLAAMRKNEMKHWGTGELGFRGGHCAFECPPQGICLGILCVA